MGACSDAVGTVESVKAASDVFTPVSGTVVEINEELVDNPALVNESPMDQAWFIRVKVGPGPRPCRVGGSTPYSGHRWPRAGPLCLCPASQLSNAGELGDMMDEEAYKAHCAEAEN